MAPVPVFGNDAGKDDGLRVAEVGVAAFWTAVLFASSRPYLLSAGCTIQQRLGDAQRTDSAAEARLASPSRRTVLFGGLGLAAIAVGAAGYELVQEGTLPGKYMLARLDGACGSPPPLPAGRRPARHVVTFESAYRHTTVQMVTLIPPGGAAGFGLGIVLALHGAGSSAAALSSQVATAMTAAKTSTLAVICVDGGDTYWHKRADGDDPIGMILHEVLPRAAAAGLATRRIGIAGESMGGYGALRLAERISGAAAPRRTRPAAGAVPAVAAVTAMSPGDLRHLCRRPLRRPAGVRQPGRLHQERRVRRDQRAAARADLGHLRRR